MKYLNRYITDDIVNKTVRTSDEERIEHFSSKVLLYQRIMEYCRNIDVVPGLLWLCKQQEHLKLSVFLVLLSINIIMLFTFKSADNRFISDESYSLYYDYLHILNLTMSFLIYLLCMVQMMPVSLFAYGNESYVNFNRRRLNMKLEAGYVEHRSLSLVYDYFNNWLFKKFLKYFPIAVRSCIKVFLDPVNLYNLFFFIIMVVAKQYPVGFGALLVIDLFRNSGHL